MPQAVSASPVKPAGGLEGVVAAKSDICFINGTEGQLVYRGYDIGDVVENLSFEEVAFLLWEGKLPNRTELSALKKQLAESMSLPKHVQELLHTMPKGTEPMDALRTAASALGEGDPDLHSNDHDANRGKAIRLTAQFPTIVTAFHQYRNGQAPIQPDPALSVAANFLYMLTGKKPHDTLVRVMDAALVLHAEHGMNASTFAARVIAATLADMHAAVTGAVAALKGPLHGGANQDVMELLLECGDAETAENKVRDMLANKQKIPGFGHRVYRTFDPRATFLRKMSKQLGEAAGNTKWYEMSERLDQRRQGVQEPESQRRFLLGQHLLHDGHSPGSVHTDLRDRADRGLDGPHHGTAHQQPDHPPDRRLHRAVRIEGRADRSERLTKTRVQGSGFRVQ